MNPELQELFDISLAHIRKQGGASTGVSGFCKYKASSGRSCAAAPFIINYKREMEGTTFEGLVFEGLYEDDLNPIAYKHPNFVGSLQMCHDKACASFDVSDRLFLVAYEGRMRDLATLAGLNYG